MVFTCNKCVTLLSGGQNEDFFLTTCAHTLCNKCAHKMEGNKCVACKQTCKIVKVDTEMPPGVKAYFEPPIAKYKELQSQLIFLKTQQQLIFTMKEQIRISDYEESIIAENIDLETVAEAKTEEYNRLKEQYKQLLAEEDRARQRIAAKLERQKLNNKKIMEPASNTKPPSDQFPDRLSYLTAVRDELNEIIAKRDAIIYAYEKNNTKVEELLSPVIGLHKRFVEHSNRMEKDKKFLEVVEDLGKNRNDQNADHIEWQQHYLQLQEEELSKRINQLNDEKMKLSHMVNDVKQQEKVKLEMERLVVAMEAELKQQREISRDNASSSAAVLKEISEHEAEYHRLENEYLKMEEELKTKKLELKELHAKKKITSGKINEQEAEYRNQLLIRKHTTIAFKDYKAKFKGELRRNEKIMQKTAKIEKDREEEIEKLNLRIKGYQDVYDKLQNELDEVTNKMKSEFGDVSSFEQIIFEEKTKLAALKIDCQTIDSSYNAECEREIEIKNRELMLLTEVAEMKQKFDRAMLEPSNEPVQSQNESGPFAPPNQHYVDTEHDFVQPIVQPLPQAMRKVRRKSRSQRPKQAATKAPLYNADSSVSEASLIQPASTEEATGGVGSSEGTWEPEHALACLDLKSKFHEVKKNKRESGIRGTPRKPLNAEIDDTEGFTKRKAVKAAKGKKTVKGNAAKGNPTKAKKQDDDEVQDYEVEDIVDEKLEKGNKYYFLKWKGYPSSTNTWELASSLSCPDVLKKYLAKQKSALKPSKSAKSKAGKKLKSPGKKSKSSKQVSKASVVEEEQDWEVEKIIDVRYNEDGTKDFQIRWKGCDSSQDTWEPENNVDSPDLVNEFMNKTDDKMEGTNKKSQKV